MDSNLRSGLDEDSRDNRTQQGISPHPIEGRDMLSEDRSLDPPQDPVDAANSFATPSSYSIQDIDSGEVPMDEDLEMLIDPSLARQRQPMSTNADVLNLGSQYLVESEEPDFMMDPGTTDIIQVVEEGDLYFAPTDPPLRAEPLVNSEVLSGFSVTSLEEPIEPIDEPLRIITNDDEIAERVRYALATDAYTSDLNIMVEVEDGVVYLTGAVRSLDDTDQAEQVAGSVPGVVEVDENLDIV
ncbi:MAG: BON domain-containing protein [Chloroflexota bacterium]|nr:BON domain-containing protein [Chloroflexota bacterium]